MTAGGQDMTDHYIPTETEDAKCKCLEVKTSSLCSYSLMRTYTNSSLESIF